MSVSDKPIYYSKQPFHRNVPGVMVLLADDEWGNRKMDDIASWYLERHPQAECVQVHEHAGWYLTYNRKMQIVGTANDACEVTPVMASFWENVWAVDWLAIIHRPEQEKSA
jgi:hypothetical protein